MTFFFSSNKNFIVSNQITAVRIMNKSSRHSKSTNKLDTKPTLLNSQGQESCHLQLLQYVRQEDFSIDCVPQKYGRRIEGWYIVLNFNFISILFIKFPSLYFIIVWRLNWAFSPTDKSKKGSRFFIYLRLFKSRKKSMFMSGAKIDIRMHWLNSYQVL